MKDRSVAVHLLAMAATGALLLVLVLASYHSIAAGIPTNCLHPALLSTWTLKDPCYQATLTAILPTVVL